MKKVTKTLFASLCAIALVFSFAPVEASAAPTDNTAYLGYCDAAYKIIYLGDPLTGVKETSETITGVGQYTIGLDFTGTADGKAVGASAVLPVIQMGEKSFPGYFIQLDSIEINGEEVSFTKGYTSVDDKGTTMSYSIYNAWAGVLPESARTPDGDLSTASSNIVDSSVFKEVKTIRVTFTLLDADGNSPIKDSDSNTTDAAVAGSATGTENTGSSSSAPKTGVVSYGLIYGAGALLTGAFALKRKKNRPA
jgi:hypothetical protein